MNNERHATGATKPTDTEKLRECPNCGEPSEYELRWHGRTNNVVCKSIKSDCYFRWTGLPLEVWQSLPRAPDTVPEGCVCVSGFAKGLNAAANYLRELCDEIPDLDHRAVEAWAEDIEALPSPTHDTVPAKQLQETPKPWSGEDNTGVPQQPKTPLEQATLNLQRIVDLSEEYGEAASNTNNDVAKDVAAGLYVAGQLAKSTLERMNADTVPEGSVPVSVYVVSNTTFATIFADRGDADRFVGAHGAGTDLDVIGVTVIPKQLLAVGETR